jgi:hypothetical protein
VAVKAEVPLVKIEAIRKILMVVVVVVCLFLF